MGDAKEFKHEINMLRNLKHPNLINVRDYFKIRNKMYLVMEKAECELKRRSWRLPRKKLAHDRKINLGNICTNLSRFGVHTQIKSNPQRYKGQKHFRIQGWFGGIKRSRSAILVSQSSSKKPKNLRLHQ